MDMDGQVAAIRAALDRAGHDQVGICAYSAKYASAFYGPFRESPPRAMRPPSVTARVIQQDPANAAEALREVALDLDEGADAMVMVKASALAYLDVIRRVADAAGVPVAAYQVSGEFAMVEAAAATGLAGWTGSARDHLGNADRDPARGRRRHPELLGRGGGSCRLGD